MEKRVISFMATKVSVLLFSVVMGLYSCSSKDTHQEIAVIQVSGEVYQKTGSETSPLERSSHLKTSELDYEILFESGFAILQLGDLQIILPKGTKRNYTVSELLEEFDNKDGNVNARYARYVSEKLIKDASKTEEDRTTKGVVSRGAQFLHAKSPNSTCSIIEDSVCFSWDTNMALDTLEIHIVDFQQRFVGSVISLPKNSSKSMRKEALGLADGELYFWQVTRKNDYPNYNAWRAFSTASLEEIAEFNSFMDPELNLSEATQKAILATFSCGCE